MHEASRSIKRFGRRNDVGIVILFCIELGAFSLT